MLCFDMAPGPRCKSASCLTPLQRATTMCRRCDTWVQLHACHENFGYCSALHIHTAEPLLLTLPYAVVRMTTACLYCCPGARCAFGMGCRRRRRDQGPGRVYLRCRCCVFACHCCQGMPEHRMSSPMCMYCRLSASAMSHINLAPSLITAHVHTCHAIGVGACRRVLGRSHSRRPRQGEGKGHSCQPWRHVRRLGRGADRPVRAVSEPLQNRHAATQQTCAARICICTVCSERRCQQRCEQLRRKMPTQLGHWRGSCAWWTAGSG